jgi:hypothetical protein
LKLIIYIQSYNDDTSDLPIVKQHAEDWIYSGFFKASTYKPISNYYKAHFINDIFLNYDHRFIYDDQALKALLEKAGFINIGNNMHPELTGIESHSSEFDRIFNLALQAQKPGRK